MEKSKLFKLLLIPVVILITGCEINDPIDNIVKVGNVAPHVYWELSSTSFSAGASVPFYAQYYPSEPGQEVTGLEVWYDINEKIEKTVTCPLVSSFTYTISSSSTTLSREFQKIIEYEHKSNYWNADKKAFVLDTVFPTSKTLKTVEWKNVSVFDNSKFNTYFPSTFAAHFKDSLYTLLKVADFRKIMVSLNIMTGTEFITYTDSTFNDNSGAYDYYIKDNMKADLKTKYDGIEFKDLIYDATNQLYKVEYSKSYLLNARLKVIDNKHTEGISENKEIELR